MNDVVVFDVAEATITLLAAQHTGLTIADLNDVVGYRAVHTARMEFKGLRTKVEARRKELKAESLEWGRRVDTEAKRLTDLIAPHEDRLLAEEKRIDAQKEAIHQAEEKSKKELIQGRQNSLFKLGATFDGQNYSLIGFVFSHDQIATQSLSQFGSFFQGLREKAETHRTAREAEEREAREKAERERQVRTAEEHRIEESRRILAEEARKQEDARREHEARMKAERNAIEAELRIIQEERDRQAREDRRKADEEARVKHEAQLSLERQKKEAEEKLERQKTEQIAREQAEAIRPDREKLLLWADELRSVIFVNPIYFTGKSAGPTLLNFKKSDSIKKLTLKALDQAIIDLRERAELL